MFSIERLLVFKCKLQWLYTFSKIQCSQFYIYKKQNKFLNKFYAKSQIFCKKTDNFRYVCIYKKSYTLRYAIFINFIYIFKNDTFLFRGILYKEIQILCKKQDNLRNVFIYKNTDTLCYAIFVDVLNWRRGGDIFLCKKQGTLIYIVHAKKTYFV